MNSKGSEGEGRKSGGGKSGKIHNRKKIKDPDSGQKRAAVKEGTKEGRNEFIKDACICVYVCVYKSGKFLREIDCEKEKDSSVESVEKGMPLTALRESGRSKWVGQGVGRQGNN